MMNYNSEYWSVNQTSAKCLHPSYFSAGAAAKAYLSMSNSLFMFVFDFFRTLKQDVIVTREDVKQDNEWKNEEVDEHKENDQHCFPIIGTSVPFKVIAIQLTPKVFLIKRMTYKSFLVVPESEVPVFLRIAPYLLILLSG